MEGEKKNNQIIATYIQFISHSQPGFERRLETKSEKMRD